MGRIRTHDAAPSLGVDDRARDVKPAPAVCVRSGSPLGDDRRPRPELRPFVEAMAEWIATRVIEDPVVQRLLVRKAGDGEVWGGLND
ncbi:MAG: hypothetical protein HY699_13030 [Deltaproteobacteria bacterium]|nr:hypothetical protein [Deltaproteobacteria bacterium]